MDETKVFAPYRCCATFIDGSRLAFDGLTREQARAAMEAAIGSGSRGVLEFTRVVAVGGQLA